MAISKGSLLQARRRGIVLIGILVLTLVVTFFIGALLQMNPTRLRRTVQDEKADKASAAAHFGVEYALQRLAESPEWKGDGTGVVLNTKDAVVREDKGNVEGWIRTESGPWTAFRLRFNYQDGSGGVDGMDDPATMMPMSEISYNNIDGGIPHPIPLASTGGTYAYEGPGDFEVPDRSVGLVVEGLASDGLEPNKDLPLSTEVSATRTVEGIYKVTGFQDSDLDGTALQAGGSVSFRLGASKLGSLDGSLELSASGRTAKTRSKKASTISRVEGGGVGPYLFYPDKGSQIFMNGPTQFTPDPAYDTLGGLGAYDVKTEPANEAMLDLKWDQVKDSKQASPIPIPAGVYVIEGQPGNSESNKDSWVRYYDMSFEDYNEGLAGKKPLGAGVAAPAEFSKRVSLNKVPGVGKAGYIVTFEQDVQINPSKMDNKDFAIIPPMGAPMASENAKVKAPFGSGVTAEMGGGGVPPGPAPDATEPREIEVRLEPSGVNSATLRTDGKVLLGSRLTGRGGAIVAKDGISLVGLGVDMKAAKQEKAGISLYSEGDILISTYDKKNNKYWDVGIDGLIYTKKNLAVLLGEEKAPDANPSALSPAWGGFDLTGAMVALGSAPRKGGSTGANMDSATGTGDDPKNLLLLNGDMTFIARRVRLAFEPKFIAPYLDAKTIRATFEAVSVTERGGRSLGAKGANGG